MSITIIEVLENALYNLQKRVFEPQRKVGLNQLENAIILLKNGRSPFDDFNEDKLKEVIKNGRFSED